MEKWLRRWRGVYCGHQTQIDINSFAILTGICQETIRDLRSAKCASGSQEGKSVLTSLKYDLECDVFNHSTSIQSSTFWLLMATCVALCVQTAGWWWWWQKWSRLLFWCFWLYEIVRKHCHSLQRMSRILCKTNFHVWYKKKKIWMSPPRASLYQLYKFVIPCTLVTLHLVPLWKINPNWWWNCSFGSCHHL